MAYYTGRFTPSITGNQTVNVGFQPTWLELEVSQKYGTTDTTIHKSSGGTDGTNQNYTTIYGNSNSFRTMENSGKILYHFEYNGSTWVNVLDSTFVAFTATGFTINNVAGTTNYRVRARCGN